MTVVRVWVIIGEGHGCSILAADPTSHLDAPTAFEFSWPLRLNKHSQSCCRDLTALAQKDLSQWAAHSHCVGSVPITHKLKNVRRRLQTSGTPLSRPPGRGTSMLEQHAGLAVSL